MRFHKMLVLGFVAILLVGVISCRFEKKEAMTPLESPKTEEMAPPMQAMPATPTPPEVAPPVMPASPETMVHPTAPPANPGVPSAGTTPEQESGY